MKPRKGDPRIWITHVTGLMSDEDHCRYAAWFKARFTYEKEKDDFDKKEYQAKHKLARDQRVEELRAAGWQVRIEDAVKFEVRGRATNTVLAGKPDIVAFKHDERLILVGDPKTGKKHLKHWYQLAMYVKWIKKTLGDRFADYTVTGELLYYDVEEGAARLLERIELLPEEITTNVMQVIVSELQTIGMDLAPERSPSELECLYCDITSADCPDRMIERPKPVEVTDF